jgi:hypothetical protein
MKAQDDVSHWVRRYRPHDGDIVLMHDNRPFAQQVVRTMASQGIFERFETATIGEFLGRDRPVDERSGELPIDRTKEVDGVG